jgi:hypothetical protein
VVSPRRLGGPTEDARDHASAMASRADFAFPKGRRYRDAIEQTSLD